MAAVDLQDLLAQQFAASAPQQEKQSVQVTGYVTEPPFDPRPLHRIDFSEQAARGMVAATRADAEAVYKARKGKAKPATESKPAQEPAAEERPHPPMTSVKGIGETLADRLAKAGYDTPEKVRAAFDSDLTDVDGVSANVLAGLRAWSEE
jgi:predicted flap endonuclease-1-like 5' DNA nuclease